MHEVRQNCSRPGRVVWRLVYKDPQGNLNSVEEEIWHASRYWFVGASHWLVDGRLEFWTQWQWRPPRQQEGEARTTDEWVDYGQAPDDDEISDMDMTHAPRPLASPMPAGQASGPPPPSEASEAPEDQDQGPAPMEGLILPRARSHLHAFRSNPY